MGRTLRKKNFIDLRFLADSIAIRYQQSISEVMSSTYSFVRLVIILK